MKFFLIAIVFLLASCNATGTADVSASNLLVPLSINFVSTHWVDEQGTLRLIDFNDEDNPCFQIQQFEQGLFEGLSQTQTLCSVVLNDQTIDVRTDPSGGLWFENFRWADATLLFHFNTVKKTYNCRIDLSAATEFIGYCFE